MNAAEAWQMYHGVTAAIPRSQGAGILETPQRHHKKPQKQSKRAVELPWKRHVIAAEALWKCSFIFRSSLVLLPPFLYLSDFQRLMPAT